MPTLTDRLAEDVPLIAVSFTDADLPAAVAVAAAGGMDVAELRIDRFARQDAGHVAARAAELAGTPSIGTVRTGSDGGSWSGSDGERRALFEAVLPHVDALDLEASSPLHRELAATVRGAGKLVIASFHDFDRTPSDTQLRELVDGSVEVGADLVKVATMVRSAEDLRRLAGFTLEQSAATPLGLIVIGMGRAGMASRVFFPALGSRLTYTFLGAAFAPGQLDLADTAAELRRYYPARPTPPGITGSRPAASASSAPT